MYRSHSHSAPATHCGPSGHVWKKLNSIWRTCCEDFKEERRGKDHPLTQSSVASLTEALSDGAVAESAHMALIPQPPLKCCVSLADNLTSLSPHCSSGVGMLFPIGQRLCADEEESIVPSIE